MEPHTEHETLQNARTDKGFLRSHPIRETAAYSRTVAPLSFSPMRSSPARPMAFKAIGATPIEPLSIESVLFGDRR